MSILVCDDSSFARKQISKALPEAIGGKIHYAKNGREGIEAVRSGKGELLFLDLNMPEMDGYEVLETIRKEDLNTMVVVVSGDIQPEARKRVMALGALDFIKKPVEQQAITSILEKYGVYPTDDEISNRTAPATPKTDIWDILKEIVNVSTGQATDLLAKLLGVFINMPIPQIKLVETSDLKRMLTSVDRDNKLSAISQGFIGNKIAGEVIMFTDDAQYPNLAKIFGNSDALTEQNKIEMLMDIGTVLIGSFLNGFSKQLDLEFSLGSPLIMNEQINCERFQHHHCWKWKKTLAIELRTTITKPHVECHLLVLFSEGSLHPLKDLLNLFLD